MKRQDLLVLWATRIIAWPLVARAHRVAPLFLPAAFSGTARFAAEMVTLHRSIGGAHGCR
jgi:hypothetical protein